MLLYKIFKEETKNKLICLSKIIYFKEIFNSFVRNILSFLKGIQFWWQMPEFLTRNRKKGAFHIKYFDQLNIPPDRVKEIAFKQKKELNIYLEDEELSFLSGLNSSSTSQISDNFSYMYGLLSIFYSFCFFASIFLPLLSDCIFELKDKYTTHIVVFSYDSIMNAPLNHSLFFKVIFFRTI